MSSQPSAEAPATKPAPVKTIAEVMPRRSSGLENAPQTTTITAIVASDITEVPPPLAALYLAVRGHTTAAQGSSLPGPAHAGPPRLGYTYEEACTGGASKRGDPT